MRFVLHIKQSTLNHAIHSHALGCQVAAGLTKLAPYCRRAIPRNRFEKVSLTDLEANDWQVQKSI